MNPPEIKTPQVQWLEQLADDISHLNSDKVQVTREYYPATGLKSAFGLIICQMYEGVRKCNDRVWQKKYRELRQDYVHYLNERISALQGKATSLQDPWILISKQQAAPFPTASSHLHDVLEAGKLIGKYQLTIPLRELDGEFKELLDRIEGVYGRYLPDRQEFVDSLLSLIKLSRKHFSTQSFEEGAAVLADVDRLIKENT